MSADLLRELIAQAGAAEDHVWRLAADLRVARASSAELLEALRVLELTTRTRVRLERQLKALEGTAADGADVDAPH